MIEKIDLDKIMKDRLYLITLSRKLNEVIDKINHPCCGKCCKKNESIGTSIVKNKIKGDECSELNNKPLDIKNIADLSTTTDESNIDVKIDTQSDEEINKIVQEKISSSVNGGTKKSVAQKNKNGNIIIRKSWGSVDKHYSLCS